MRSLLCTAGALAPLRRRAALTLAALLAMCGCSSSVLIRPDDQVFAHAQERMARTQREVATLDAPEAERTLFLTGEALYRYRFDFPPRSAASFFVEAAAASTDFPALQSLAGSFDMRALRLRAPDGAVQLWETLLVRAPQTRLRPLALYRLGWAYRSAGAEGLPRESADEPFEILVREQPGSPLAQVAQDALRTPARFKSTAALLSLVPGLGQLYVGEKLNGAVRVVVAVLAAAAIVAPAWVAARRGTDLAWRSDWPLIASGLGGLIVLSYDYTSSYEDAMRGVMQWNERAEADFEKAHPDAP